MSYTLLERIIQQQNEIAQATRNLEFIHTHLEALKTVDLGPSMYGSSMCDWDNLSHEDTLRVIKAFPGKWNKTPNYSGSGIDYTREEALDGRTLRVWCGEPPPSCKIETTETWEVIPERIEKVIKRKIICPEIPTSSTEPSTK